ncbi:MAG: single-stranded-DNA-specific exonuclease RecJ [Gammaproteobacteria bacterium]|nr:single-stranded-DNA-specific exonuclease RecJ [Gammaproteobacteria bacterium]MDH5801014.1 single-stranded-DNA-specific exonuclease RecJ [Gammaproteobacteria bacterium]
MEFTIVRRKTGNKNIVLDSHPVLNRVYQSRQVESQQELQSSLQQLLPHEALGGLSAAVALLRQALDQQQRVLVVGDFDADGATSTAVAVRALRLFGLTSVSYLVPNRFHFGYGLTEEIVDLARDYTPDLIITVDNGISSHAGVERAKALGVKVLVTDHHLPAATLPSADAIVNPNCMGDAFPSKSLAGVGTIFYVMLALRASLRECDWFRQKGQVEPNLAQLLDLVALGTVADVVALDRNNRILVAQGLARIRKNRCCAGIQALIQVSGRRQNSVVAADLGFALGPRLNAAGRMEDMSIGIECLLTDSPEQALALARELDRLNQDRKQVESQMKRDAMEWLQDMHLGEEQDLPLGLCLYDGAWHKGVIGILASRIKDEVHRPVIAFADVSDKPQNSLIQGSARSISGVHIRDVLDAVAARKPHLLKKFGGHAMAAGLTLERRAYEEFSKEFAAEVGRHISPADIGHTVMTDGELPLEYLNLELARLIKFGGPWGQAFPEPLFDGEFELLERRVVGEKHLKLRLRPSQGKTELDAIAFGVTDEHWPLQVQKVLLVYQLGINEYNGKVSLQLLVQHIRPLEGGRPAGTAVRRETLETV